MKKRILAMLLAAMLMVSMLPVSALAADATSGAEYARAVLPDIGFYSSPVASAEMLIQADEESRFDFKFTEDHNTVYVIASNGHTIKKVSLTTDLDNYITCIEEGKCYAIVVYEAWNEYTQEWNSDGTYFDLFVHYDNNETIDYRLNVSVEDRSGFYYRCADYKDGRVIPVVDVEALGERKYFAYYVKRPISGMLNAREVAFYFDDGTGEKLLKPEELGFGNSNILWVNHQSNYDEHVVKIANTYTGIAEDCEVGTTAIKYMAPDGRVYEIPFIVDAPDFGLYENATMKADSLSSTFELTLENNVFYAGANNGYKLVEISTRSVGENWPKHEVKISDDGLTAEIKILEPYYGDRREQFAIDYTLQDAVGETVEWTEFVNIVFVPETDACTHTPVTDTAVAATCTATGLTEGSHCSKCGEVLTAQEVVPATGHKPEPVKGKAATCTEAGLTDGSKCSACGEVLKAQEEIPVKAHSFKDGKCSVCGAKDPNYVEPTPTPPAVTPTPPAGDNPFTDVADDAWYAAPVLWAKANNVTGGKTETTFGPDDGCTRAQVVTFLWAANGKPEPKSMNNPFKDVADNAWYLKPVLWAVEQGITTGISATEFGPENTCTRAQIATFLYAAAGKPEVSGKSSFKDVKDADWFAKPIIWAAQNEVTGGIGDGKFGPNNTCTRAQVVTFLYKVYG